MTQMSPNEIMIVGGFNGKFLNDHFILKFDSKYNLVESHQNKNHHSQNLQLFPFQVPTLGDIPNRKVFTVDWQYMTLYEFSDNCFNYKMHLGN
mmetsp:Transcript_1064/g.1975  ORF Transcript_1064/g.1975 Transcript_1064/m.1975 type:complete len:93 (+) Transcript_1064:1148-1426(+)